MKCEKEVNWTFGTASSTDPGRWSPLLPLSSLPNPTGRNYRTNPNVYQFWKIRAIIRLKNRQSKKWVTYLSVEMWLVTLWPRGWILGRVEQRVTWMDELQPPTSPHYSLVCSALLLRYTLPSSFPTGSLSSAMFLVPFQWTKAIF